MFCISQLVRGKRKKIQVLCYCNVSFFCHIVRIMDIIWSQKLVCLT